MKNHKILVTGCFGFIGFHVSNLLSEQYSVFGLDYLQQNHNIYSLRKKYLNKTIQYRIIDITDYDELNNYVSKIKPDIIIHLAAQTGISKSKESPKDYFQSNIAGFFNMLEVARNNNITNLIYASSSSVYGNLQKNVFSESDVLEKQLSFYSTTKLINEKLAESYSLNFGTNTFGLRFFTVYGSWTRPDMAAWKFMDAIINNKEVTLYNEGNVSRDFTHVSDIANSILLLYEKIIDIKQNNTSKIFNVGNGKSILIKDYFSEIKANFSNKSNVIYTSLPKDEMKKTVADTTLLENYINYKSNIPLKKGVKEMTDWYKKYILKETTRI